MDIVQIREIAKTGTRRALAAACAGHGLPKAVQERLVLSEGDLDDEHVVFELYVPGHQPTDAVVIASAVVHRHTGDVDVQVFPERIVEQANAQPSKGRGIDF